MQIRPLSRIRTLIQLVISIVANGYFPGWLLKPHLYTGAAKGATPPILNCYACPGAYMSCPVGSFQHYMVIKAIPFYVLGVMIAVGAMVGRFFCGWACPFGFAQDILSKIGTRKLKMPRWMRFGKYLFLIATVFIIPYLISDTVFCKICPQGALEGGIPQMLLNPELHHLARTLFWTKVAILTIVIVAAIFIKRIFCRAICPLGAFLALFTKVSLLQMRVDKAKCTSCGWCRKICPVDISSMNDVNSPECIRCGLCTACPQNAVAVKFTTIFAPQSPAEIAHKVPESA